MAILVGYWLHCPGLWPRLWPLATLPSSWLCCQQFSYRLYDSLIIEMPFAKWKWPCPLKDTNCLQYENSRKWLPCRIEFYISHPHWNTTKQNWFGCLGYWPRAEMGIRQAIFQRALVYVAVRLELICAIVERWSNIWNYLIVRCICCSLFA